MASKFRLDTEALRVETFATEARREEKGTVFGHGSDQSTCHQILCGCTYDVGPGMGTCDLSCMDPCQVTNINCGGGSGGCSAVGTCTCPQTEVATCATGNQIVCKC